MKGTNRSLDYLRGDREFKEDRRHRGRGVCPECEKIFNKELDEAGEE